MSRIPRDNPIRALLAAAAVVAPRIPLSVSVDRPTKGGVLLTYYVPGPGSIEDLRVLVKGTTTYKVSVEIMVVSGAQTTSLKIPLINGKAVEAGPLYVNTEDMITISLTGVDGKDYGWVEGAWMCGLYVPKMKIGLDPVPLPAEGIPNV